jgi:hypothetical protein
MGAITSAMQQNVQRLTEAGIRATLDPRNLNPPCVIIGPPSVILDSNCGGLATVSAMVVGPGPGNLDAWRAIDDLAEQVGRLIDVETITPTELTVDNNPPQPALQLTWTQSFDWPT